MSHNNPGMEKGKRWQRILERWFRKNGLPWAVGTGGGSADLLDFTGCEELGFLVGAKYVGAGRGLRLAEWMDQADAARGRAHQGGLGWLHPVQIINRPRTNADPDAAYVVMQGADFIGLIRLLNTLHEAGHEAWCGLAGRHAAHEWSAFGHWCPGEVTQ